jgi:hypothetical protein
MLHLERDPADPPPAATTLERRTVVQPFDRMAFRRCRARSWHVPHRRTHHAEIFRHVSLAKVLSQHNESGETKRRFLCVTRRWFGIGDMCVESVSSHDPALSADRIFRRKHHHGSTPRRSKLARKALSGSQTLLGQRPLSFRYARNQARGAQALVEGSGQLAAQCPRRRGRCFLICMLAISENKLTQSRAGVNHRYSPRLVRGRRT